MKEIYICQNYVTPTFFGEEKRERNDIIAERDEITRIARKVYKDINVVPTHRLPYDTELDDIISIGFDIQDYIANLKAEDGVIIFSDNYFNDKFCNTVQYVAGIYNISNVRFFELKRALDL